jgi:hypothetical protein
LIAPAPNPIVSTLAGKRDVVADSGVRFMNAWQIASR